MGVETVWQFREIEALIDTDGPAELVLRTELPGHDIQMRHAVSLNTETTTTGRRPVNIRLPGYVKGALLSPALTPQGTAIIYSARILGRPLGSAAGWRWLELPVRPTPEPYAPAALPIRSTPEGFASANLPIRPTPEAFGELRLPIHATPPVAAWVDLPVDAVE